MGDGAIDALRGYIRSGMPRHRNPPWSDHYCSKCHAHERSISGNYTICSFTGERHLPKRRAKDTGKK